MQKGRHKKCQHGTKKRIALKVTNESVFYIWDKLDSYLKTTQDHYHSSFLSSLPLTLQVQDDVVFHRKLNMGE